MRAHIQVAAALLIIEVLHAALRDHDWLLEVVEQRCAARLPLSGVEYSALRPVKREHTKTRLPKRWGAGVELQFPDKILPLLTLMFWFTGLSSLWLFERKGKLFLHLSTPPCCKLPTSALPRLRSLEQVLQKNGFPRHVSAGFHCVVVPVCNHACRCTYKPSL